MRAFRYREQPFDGGQLSEAITNAGKRKDKRPEEFGFEFNIKSDIPCRITKSCNVLAGPYLSFVAVPS